MAHVTICMLAYKIEKYLRKCWKDLDLTVEEGIKALSMIGSIVIQIGSNYVIKPINPNKDCINLLTKINVKIPQVLPYRKANVDTYKKLVNRRK